MVYSERYGTTFSEAFISSLIGAVFPIVLYLAARFEWVRQKLPAPGEGPDNVLDKSYFSFAAWALPEGGSEGGVRLKSTFAVRVHCSANRAGFQELDPVNQTQKSGIILYVTTYM